MRNVNYFMGLISVLLCAVAFLSAPLASADLVPHQAYYDVKIKVFRGLMVTELQSADGAYTGTSEITPRGFARLASNGTIENRSQFKLGDAGIEPMAFEGKDTISKRKKHASLAFDWDDQRVTGLASQKKSGKRVETVVDVPVEDGMHDAISLQYALMHDLQNGQLRTQYTLVDGGERKLINVTQRDAETVRVPYGEFEVIPVDHQVESSSRVTTFWLARELNYLPVKIEQRRKGKRLMKAELGEYREFVPAALGAETQSR